MSEGAAAGESRARSEGERGLGGRRQRSQARPLRGGAGCRWAPPLTQRSAGLSLPVRLLRALGAPPVRTPKAERSGRGSWTTCPRAARAESSAQGPSVAGASGAEASAVARTWVPAYDRPREPP